MPLASGWLSEEFHDRPFRGASFETAAFVISGSTPWRSGRFGELG